MRAMEHTISFSGAPEAVFDFVTTLGHWPRWYPATFAVDGQTTRPAQAGDRVIERVRKLGIPGTLHWTVLESRRPSRFVMETTAVDMFLFRRARLRISYDFVAADGGTRMVRTWRYSTPGLLALIDRIHLHRNLREESDVALGRLRALFEGEVQSSVGERFEAARVATI